MDKVPNAPKAPDPTILRMPKEESNRVSSNHGYQLPPSMADIEIAVISYILSGFKDSYKVFDLIAKADVFYVPTLQVIYKVLQDLHRRNHPTDLLTLFSHLQGSPYLSHWNGDLIYAQANINSLLNSEQGFFYSLPNPIEHYCNLLVSLWIRRELIAAGNDISVSGHDQITDLDNILDDAERKIYGLRALQVKRVTLPNQEVSEATWQKLHHPNQIYATGFAALDKKIVGVEAETLSIFAGRASMGKTATSLQLLLQFTLLHELPSIYFSLEMTAAQLQHRLWSLISVHPAYGHHGFKPMRGIRLKQHLSGINPFTEEELQNLSAIKDESRKLNLYINDQRGITPTGVASECRKLWSMHGNQLGVVIIDYLQLFSTGSGDSSEKSNALQDVTRYFYNLAQELKCPVILLAQVNRGPEGRQDKRPNMSDLAQCGGIEWVADNVVLLYRDSYYNPEAASDDYEMIIAKCRQGETGTARLAYNLHDQLIYDVTQNDVVY